jgi:3-mercaptopyruvate sulfurtransferase SseA
MKFELSKLLWDVGICCDTHVLFRSRPAKLFRAGRVCWILDGAPCVAVSWLAGGRVWWTWKGSLCVAVSGLAAWLAAEFGGSEKGRRA